MQYLRVLIFDDDLVINPEFLAPSFDDLNASGAIAYEVVYRGHADDAVDDVAEVDADIVFMDFQMGRHDDGATAVRALREVFDHETLPILAISSDSRFNQLMLAAGATEGCVKMALPQHLGALMTLLLSVRSAVSPTG